MHDDRLWPYPIMDLISGAAVLVDGSAHRFVDEGVSGVNMTNAIARLADPLSASVIFDQAIWDGPATEFILPANPHLALAGGTILAAASLDELALKLALPAEELKQTIAEYNAAIERDATQQLSPARTVTKTRAHPVKHPPYYAVRLAAGITYTMGGLATDEFGCVLRESGETIPGLYASGCATGGLDGGSTAGYVSGLTKSAVMSLRVAEHLAKAGSVATSR
jgi:fumarate reductase flavoprotein subunit